MIVLFAGSGNASYNPSYSSSQHGLSYSQQVTLLSNQTAQWYSTDCYCYHISFSLVTRVEALECMAVLPTVGVRDKATPTHPDLLLPRPTDPVKDSTTGRSLPLTTGVQEGQAPLAPTRGRGDKCPLGEDPLMRVHMDPGEWFVCLFACLFVCLFDCLFDCLFVCLRINLLILYSGKLETKPLF